MTWYSNKKLPQKTVANGFGKKGSPESHSSRWHGRIEYQQAAWKIFSMLAEPPFNAFSNGTTCQMETHLNKKIITDFIIMVGKEHQSSSIHHVYLSPICMHI